MRPRASSHDFASNNNTGISIGEAWREPLKPCEIERGQRLGALLREARGSASIGAMAATAGMSVETLRKIETGRISTPSFFTVAALADVLGLSLDDVAEFAVPDDTGSQAS